MQGEYAELRKEHESKCHMSATLASYIDELRVTQTRQVRQELLRYFDNEKQFKLVPGTFMKEQLDAALSVTDRIYDELIKQT
jgi:hypothetical protein